MRFTKLYPARDLYTILFHTPKASRKQYSAKYLSINQKITNYFYICTKDPRNIKHLKRLFSMIITLMIIIPATAQTEKTIKRKVAIGRFSNETQYAKGVFYDKENDPMRKQAMDILKAESAYDSEIFFDRNLEPFNRYFGADAVVFSIIDSWTKKGFGIETKIRYVIKSAYTNEIMFDRSCDLYLDLSINSGSGGILGAVVDLAASAITTAATDHIVAARKANYFILSDMPRGKYSPEYMQDQDVKAMQKEMSAVVK